MSLYVNVGSATVPTVFRWHSGPPYVTSFRPRHCARARPRSFWVAFKPEYEDEYEHEDDLITLSWGQYRRSFISVNSEPWAVNRTKMKVNTGKKKSIFISSSDPTSRGLLLIPDTW